MYVFGPDIRIANFSCVIIAISNVRLHKKEFRTVGAVRIGECQLLFVRQRVSQMYGWEHLKTIHRAVRTFNRTSQHLVCMFTSHPYLYVKCFIAVTSHDINGMNTPLKIESVIDILPPIKLLFLRIPELHRVIAVFQIRMILIPAFQQTGLAIRIAVGQIALDCPAFFVFPRTVSLLALFVLVEKVTLEIFKGIVFITQHKAAG